MAVGTSVYRSALPAGIFALSYGDPPAQNSGNDRSTGRPWKACTVTRIVAPQTLRGSTRKVVAASVPAAARARETAARAGRNAAGAAGGMLGVAGERMTNVDTACPHPQRIVDEFAPELHRLSLLTPMLPREE